uniref:Uncharacterized protein n=1 Tax=Arundo donax TaxID=35708 RepID=A0A0A9HX40_ARUDO
MLKGNRKMKNVTFLSTSSGKLRDLSVCQHGNNLCYIRRYFHIDRVRLLVDKINFKC